MIRFKEFAGFLLLGSVIFIIYYTDKRFTIPLLVMLLGVAVGLWMIGNLYDVNSHIRHKMAVRVVARVGRTDLLGRIRTRGREQIYPRLGAVLGVCESRPS